MILPMRKLNQDRLQSQRGDDISHWIPREQMPREWPKRGPEGDFKSPVKAKSLLLPACVLAEPPTLQLTIEERKRKWSRSVVSDSVRPQGLQAARLLCPWNSPGKNTRGGCHTLLQGIFPTQGLNPGLPHCRQKFYCLSYQGSPTHLLKVITNRKASEKRRYIYLYLHQQWLEPDPKSCDKPW